MKTATIQRATERAYAEYLDDPASWRKSRRYVTFRDALLARIEAGDRAREALLDVEWVRHREDGDICPWCYANKHWENHATDCPRQIALGISNVTE